MGSSKRAGHLGARRGAKGRRWTPIRALAVVAGAFLLVALWLISAPAQEEPSRYYTEGARPTRDSGRVYQETEGCVPYSRSRPDIQVCGTLPKGYEPPAQPGGYEEYRGVCDQAAAQHNRDRASAAQDLSPQEAEEQYPAIDISSCFVAPTSRYSGRAPDEIDYHVGFAPTRKGAEPVAVRLNTE